MPTRTPQEIRASIEHNRQELGSSLDKLRGEVDQLTDWRAQLRANQLPLSIAAAGAGFFLGGGIAGLTDIVFGRRRRRKKRKRGLLTELTG
jgi:Protein of unknown function (DUF3618)